MFSIELILLLCTLQLASIKANNSQDALICIDAPFSCNHHDKSIAYLKDSNEVIRCGPGEQCNSENLMPCDPCIVIPPKCGNAFFCNDNDLSKFHNVSGEFECEKNYVCNAKYENHCEPCVKKTCNSKFPWACITENLFIMHDSFHMCPEGTFCNKLNKFPCTPCVKSYNERKHSRRLPFYQEIESS